MKNNIIIESTVVPLLQSFITSILITITVGLLLRVAIELEFDWKILNAPWSFTFFVLFASMTFFWFAFRGNWNDRVNAVYGLDTKTVGNQQYASETQTMHLNIYGDHGGNFMNLPCEKETLISFAKGVTNGKNITVRAWTGSSGLFTPSQFEDFRTELILHGYARWKGKDYRNGVVLTKKGEAIFNYLAKCDMPTSSPTKTGYVVKPSRIP